MDAASEVAGGFPPGIKFLNSIQETCRAINRSRASVYEMIAASELDALKDGARVLITGESIVRRTRNLPKAAIGQSKQLAA